MTPLLGTKTPSEPVGAKSGGDRRAARSLLSCALWRGMGRLWRGMGGMGRPEQLSAYHPHQQQGLSGFHATRDPRPETRLLLGARRKPARIPRFSRNTNHETRITAFTLFTKHVFFGHVPCSDFPPFPTISHDFPAFPRYPPPPRIKCPPPHCRRPGHRLHGCIALSCNGPGLHVSPSGKEKSGRVARRESGLSTSTTANRRNTVKTAGRTACLGFWGHETRNTNHGFSRSMAFTVVRFAVGAQGMHNRKPPPGPPRLPPSHCLPVRCGAAVARVERLLWCGWSGSERHGAAYCP